MKSGNSYLLDTNAVIALLSGESALSTKIKDASWIGISVITYLEFLSFSRLSEKDSDLFKLFCKRIEVCSLDQKNQPLLDEIISLRKTSSIKLPDAIICMTAKSKDAVVLTRDVQLLKSDFISAEAW